MIESAEVNAKEEQLPEHIVRRGPKNILYARFTVDDVSYLLSTRQSKSVRYAVDRKNFWRKAAIEKRFEDIKATQVVRNIPAMCELIDAYRAAALMRGLAKPTIYGCIWSLTAVIGVPADSSAKATFINGATVKKWLDDFLAERGNSDRARSSAASMLRQAKRVFAKWALEYYKDMNLPDLAGFLAAGNIKVQQKVYTTPLTHPDLCAKTPIEGRKLRMKNPEKDPAYILRVQLELLASEAVCVRWNWIEERGGSPSIVIMKRPDEGYALKSTARVVKIDAASFAALKASRSKDPYIIPGGTEAKRAMKVRRAEDAMRYSAFLLSYDVALRAGEAEAARWTWIQPHDGIPSMWVIKRPEEKFKPKGKSRAVAIDARTLAELESMRKVDCPFILPCRSKEGRRTLMRRKLAGWMRSIGWDEETFPKAAHELRKLRGCQWFQDLGPAVAQLWLGHISLNTTCTFYSMFLKQPKPIDRGA